MAIKKILLKKKIDGVLYDIYTQTSADLVAFSETESLSDKLASIATSIEGITADTTGTIDVKVKAASDALYEKIMGVTNAEDINTAYDTLKEVADYLVNNGSVLNGILSDISDLQTDLTALTTRVDAVETKVSNLETVIGNEAVTDEEGTVTSEATGLRKAVADNAAAIEELKTHSGISASKTNGNIVVNGEEIKVYDDTSVTKTSVVMEAPDEASVDGNELVFVVVG